MAWKPTNRQAQTQTPTTQQRQAAAAQQPPDLTNDDIERMIDLIPETAAAGGTAQVIGEKAPEPLTASQVPSPSPIPTDDEIAELITKLSPAQLTKARLQIGVPAGGGLRRLPGGGIEVVIKLSADLVGPLESWAEAAGKTLEEQIQELAETSLSSFIFQDWGTVVPAPVTVPVAVPAPVSGTPPPSAAK